MNQQQRRQLLELFRHSTPEAQQAMLMQLQQYQLSQQLARSTRFENAMIQQELLSNAPWLETEALELDREIAKTGYQTPVENTG